MHYAFKNLAPTYLHQTLHDFHPRPCRSRSKHYMVDKSFYGIYIRQSMGNHSQLYDSSTILDNQVKRKNSALRKSRTHPIHQQGKRIIAIRIPNNITKRMSGNRSTISRNLKNLHILCIDLYRSCRSCGMVILGAIKHKRINFFPQQRLASDDVRIFRVKYSKKHQTTTSIYCIFFPLRNITPSLWSTRKIGPFAIQS